MSHGTSFVITIVGNSVSKECVPAVTELIDFKTIEEWMPIIKKNSVDYAEYYSYFSPPASSSSIWDKEISGPRGLIDYLNQYLDADEPKAIVIKKEGCVFVKLTYKRFQNLAMHALENAKKYITALTKTEYIFDSPSVISEQAFPTRGIRILERIPSGNFNDFTIADWIAHIIKNHSTTIDVPLSDNDTIAIRIDAVLDYKIKYWR